MKALLVDDERLARAGLRRMLKAHEDVEVVGDAANTAEAAALVGSLNPDVIFLDVEMPGKTGLQLLEELHDVPLVIFTTAYQEYAVHAFEVSALDYLVKPISPERLAAALDKVRKALQREETTALSKPGKYLRQVFLREGDRCWIVETAQVHLLESEGNYTRVYFEGNRPLIYKSLSAFEARLNPAIFVRASRSHIVNYRSIKSLQAEADGSLIATLVTGQTVAISRRQSRKLRALMSV